MKKYYSMLTRWMRRIRKDDGFWRSHASSFAVSALFNLLVVFLVLQFSFASLTDNHEDVEVEIVQLQFKELDVLEEIIEEQEPTEDLVENQMQKPDMNTDAADLEPSKPVLTMADSPLKMAALNGFQSVDMRGILDAGKQSTRFMGTQAKGNRFAFIIDYSLSMSKDQFAMMKHELNRAIQAIGDDRLVTVLFFSGPVWRPDEDAENVAARFEQAKGKGKNKDETAGLTEPKWFKTTDNNLKAMERYIHTTPKTLGTDWYKPIKLALDMHPRPDMITFMTDGTVAERISNETIAYIKQLPPFLTRINTIALGVDEEKAAPLRTIAELTGGEFKSYDTEELKKAVQTLPDAPEAFPANNIRYYTDGEINQLLQQNMTNSLAREDNVTVEIL